MSESLSDSSQGAQPGEGSSDRGWYRFVRHPEQYWDLRPPPARGEDTGADTVSRSNVHAYLYLFVSYLSLFVRHPEQYWDLRLPPTRGEDTVEGTMYVRNVHALVYLLTICAAFRAILGLASPADPWWEQR